MVIQTFFSAYNRHDLPGVLAVLSNINYSDCDYAHHTFYMFQNQADLSTWLQSRFADQDRFDVLQIIIGSASGTPPSDPTVVGVQIRRTSNTLQAMGITKQLGAKILLTKSGDAIDTVSLESSNACEGY